jgi:LacI family transcriptional regulator
MLNARPRRRGVPCVVPDDRSGARAAVTELLEHGHRRIGFINDRYGTVAADLRLAGYREALRAYGVRFDKRLVTHAEPGLATSAVAALDLYDHAGATGLFCFNDRVAVGAVRGLHGRGLDVPADVSVVGYDDQEFVADHANPPLTTIKLPHYAMGEWAARTLVALINGETVSPEPCLMACDLVRRDSVGPPPARVP